MNSKITTGKWLAVWRDGAWRVVTDNNVPIATVDKWTHQLAADKWNTANNSARAELNRNHQQRK